MGVSPITVHSVVNLAYEEIRTRIVGGDLPAQSRLGQAELAETLGISRTSVREALRRLTGDGLVVFETNRGFFVADLGIDAVLGRLEARLLVEPSAARLAAQRRTDDDLDAMERSIAGEAAGRSAAAVHDASRDFHIAVAHATANGEVVRIVESLWNFDIGRRLVARRRAVPSWQCSDADEHRAVADAIRAGAVADAETAMRDHISRALEHWSAAAGGVRT